jgi:hypothetical protein
MKKNVWHQLYEGFLDDAPGRCESWTEEICYLEKNKWLLRYSGTDFSGTEENESSQEEKDTNDLLDWIIESDGYDLESSQLAPFFDTEKTQLIGPRTILFRKLARKYKLEDCLFDIDKIEVQKITLLLDSEFRVEVTDYEKMKQRKRLKVLISDERLRAYNKKSNLVNRLVSQYNKPGLVKRGRGGVSGLSEFASYRNKLLDYIENYYDKNNEIPSGIHMIEGIDKPMSEPIGFIDFDALELKACTMWEEYLGKNEHNISWKEVDSGKRRNGVLIGSFYCSWLLEDGYVSVYAKSPIKSDSNWYLKVIYPVMEDGGRVRRTIQSNNFISLCSYLTHEELDFSIKDFVIGCDNELSIKYDEVRKVVYHYWGKQGLM